MWYFWQDGGTTFKMGSGKFVCDWVSLLKTAVSFSHKNVVIINNISNPLGSILDRHKGFGARSVFP